MVKNDIYNAGFQEPSFGGQGGFHKIFVSYYCN